MSGLRRLLLAAALVAAAPLDARPLPSPESIASSPKAKALLPRVKAIARPDLPFVPAERLAEADRVLAELPPPAPLRGLVQLMRSELLFGLDREEEAAAAVDEAIALLPGYSAPHFVAAHGEIYRDNPGRAADHLFAAGAIDLEMIAGLDEFDANALVRQLDQKNDRDRLARLGDLLARARWQGAPDTASTLALARIEARLKAGERDAAASLIGEVLRPETFSRLLTETSYAPIRAASVAHAGPRLERLWPRYLALAQSQWQSEAHERVRRVYGDALIEAGHDKSLIATFAPLFERRIDVADHSLLFAVVPVARAYARLGQWQSGYDLLARVAAAYAHDDPANRLNVTAARAQLLQEQGRIAEAAAAFDALIAQSQLRSAEVGEHNLTLMHGRRACLLDQLGRSADAASSWRIIRARERADPGTLVFALMCRDDLAGARKALIAALENEATRSEALDMVQPPARGPFPSDYSRRSAERWTRLRADPELRAAASLYADLLAERLNAAAPLDPMLGRDTPAP